MKPKKLTSDRIATLGSKMMKFAKGIAANSRVVIMTINDDRRSRFHMSDLTVGDIRDAGASLVSQADGPEPVALKQKKIALKQSRKRKAGK